MPPFDQSGRYDLNGHWYPYPSVAKGKTYPGIYYKYSRRLKIMEYGYKKKGSYIKIDGVIGKDEYFDQGSKAWRELDKIKKDAAGIERDWTYGEVAEAMIRTKKGTNKEKLDQNLRKHYIEIWNKNIKDVDDEDFEDIQENLLFGSYEQLNSEQIKAYSPNTVNFIIQIGKQVINYAIYKKKIPSPDPIRIEKIKASNQRHGTMTPKQIKKTLYFLKKRKDKKFFLIAALSATTGARHEDIALLQVKNLKFDEDKIFYRGTKHGNKRHIAMHPVIKKYLEEHVKNKGQENLVFTNKNNEKIKNISIQFQKVFNMVIRENDERGSEDKITFHNYRHSFATLTLKNNILNVKELQIQLGHKKLETTLRYIHADEDDVMEKVQRIWNK